MKKKKYCKNKKMLKKALKVDIDKIKKDASIKKYSFSMK